MKLLIWLALAAFVVLWFLHQKKRKAAARQASPAPAARGSAHTPVAENMLPCAACGVHLPRSEAILSPDGKLAWCCQAHQQQQQHRSSAH